MVWKPNDVEHHEATAVEEYGQLYVGNEVLVWNRDPKIETLYPLAERVMHGRRGGGRVMRRRVIVVTDWEEVTENEVD